jgi:hypothetical protein
MATSYFFFGEEKALVIEICCRGVAVEISQTVSMTALDTDAAPKEERLALDRQFAVDPI